MRATADGRDRLRELLDAVLAEDHTSLDEMAAGAHSSPHHFTRQLRRLAGEPPVAMRRRVVLERAAWQLRQDRTVTAVAFAAGYESVEGFARAYARAFGHPPSDTTSAGPAWLPAPNGIHFHPPASLWVHQTERPVNPVPVLMLDHDLADTEALLTAAADLGVADYRRAHPPRWTVLSWDGPEDSVAQVLERVVRTKEIWLAALEGADTPPAGSDDLDALSARHAVVAPRWQGFWHDVERRGAWDDVLVDALCDPPESFVLSSVLAHVLTFGAHRRLLVRSMLRAGGLDLDDGDPIRWLRARQDRGA